MAAPDLDALNQLVQYCFAISGSDAFDDDVRDAFLQQGEALRDRLEVATAEEWQAADGQLDALNAQVRAAVEAVKDEQTVEQRFAQTIAQVTKIVTVVGQIVKAV